MTKKWDYKPGQYLFLNCPYLSQNEWHPFTITSSPHQDVLTVHIRVCGDWTGALARLLNPTKSRDLRLNKVRLHGRTTSAECIVCLTARASPPVCVCV